MASEKFIEHVQEIFDQCIEDDEAPGFLFMVMNVSLSEDEWNFSKTDSVGMEISHPLFPLHVSEDELSLAVLENLSLVKSNVHTFQSVRCSGFIIILHLTRFGLEFYLACNPEVAGKIDDSYEESGLKRKRSRKVE